MSEYKKVADYIPPTGYNFKRNGEIALPNMMQKLTVQRVIDYKRYGNWSGTGAGKTSSLAAYPDLRKSAEMIYDTNMNKLESAQQKIDQALKAGRKVDLVFTYRDPVESLVEGSLKRAMRMKEELGSGRTVPLKEHIRTHIGSREVIGQLQNIYGDNPNVRIGLIDNRYGKENPKVAKSLDDLPAFDPKQLEKDLRSALEQQYKSGKIDKDIYEASQ